MIRDLFNRELYIGDYISFPLKGDFSHAKVLDIKNGGYGRVQLKLSCFMRCRIFSDEPYFYIDHLGIEDLKLHNSFMTRFCIDRRFVIISDMVGKPIDDTKLYSKSKLKRLKKLENV